MANGLAGIGTTVAGGTNPGGGILDQLTGMFKGDPTTPVDRIAALEGVGYGREALTGMTPLEIEQTYKAAGLGQPTGMSGGDLMKTGLGVGQLGLGLASFLDSRKTNEMNRRLMQQQYDTNVESLANRRRGLANLESAFKAPTV